MSLVDCSFCFLYNMFVTYFVKYFVKHFLKRLAGQQSCQGPFRYVPVGPRSGKLVCQHQGRDPRARDQLSRCPFVVGQPSWSVSIGPGTRGSRDLLAVGQPGGPVSIRPGTRGVGVRWWLLTVAWFPCCFVDITWCACCFADSCMVFMLF